MTPIDVILDVREYTGPAASPAELMALWSGIEYALAGRPLEDHLIPCGADGRVTVRVITRERGTFSPATPVAISGVLQRLVPGRCCDLCQDGGQPASFASFACCCTDCERARWPVLLCERHAIIPSGGEVAFHPGHAPRCPAPSCGARATFWCDGHCDRAWCDAHRRWHPSSPDHAYCEPCYQEHFPACSFPGCANLAALRCEHVEAAEETTCDRWVCPLHGTRWQVYGRDEDGLGRCPTHARIPELTQSEILRQILYATVLRQIRKGDRRPVPFPRLPRLRAMNYIYRNARQTSPTYPALRDAFARAAAQTGQGRAGRLLKQRLDAHMAALTEELDKLVDATTELRGRLRALLLAAGMEDVADAIEIRDYKPDKRLAFWKLPDHLKGRFIGRGGQNIKLLSQQLGVTLREDERTR